MTIPHPYLDIGVEQRTCPGETACGDAVRVSTTSNRTLIAVADGLGHGHEARRAAEAFCDALSLEEESIAQLLRHAHLAIAGTRGVAALLLRLDHDEGILSSVGFGTVECQAIAPSPLRPISTPG